MQTTCIEHFKIVSWLCCTPQAIFFDIFHRFIKISLNFYDKTECLWRFLTEHSQTLAIGEIPSHTHSASVTDPGHSHKATTTSAGGTYGAKWGQNPTSYTDSATTGISVSNSSTGGGGSFDNQPAFLELQYIIRTWKLFYFVRVYACGSKVFS